MSQRSKKLIFILAGIWLAGPSICPAEVDNPYLFENYDSGGRIYYIAHGLPDYMWRTNRKGYEGIREALKEVIIDQGFGGIRIWNSGGRMFWHDPEEETLSSIFVGHEKGPVRIGYSPTGEGYNQYMKDLLRACAELDISVFIYWDGFDHATMRSMNAGTIVPEDYQGKDVIQVRIYEKFGDRVMAINSKGGLKLYVKDSGMDWTHPRVKELILALYKSYLKVFDEELKRCDVRFGWQGEFAFWQAAWNDTMYGTKAEEKKYYGSCTVERFLKTHPEWADKIDLTNATTAASSIKGNKELCEIYQNWKWQSLLDLHYEIARMCRKVSAHPFYFRDIWGAGRWFGKLQQEALKHGVSFKILTQTYVIAPGRWGNWNGDWRRTRRELCAGDNDFESVVGIHGDPVEQISPELWREFFGHIYTHLNEENRIYFFLGFEPATQKELFLRYLTSTPSSINVYKKAELPYRIGLMGDVDQDEWLIPFANTLELPIGNVWVKPPTVSKEQLKGLEKAFAKHKFQVLVVNYSYPFAHELEIKVAGLCKKYGTKIFFYSTAYFRTKAPNSSPLAEYIGWQRPQPLDRPDYRNGLPEGIRFSKDKMPGMTMDIDESKLHPSGWSIWDDYEPISLSYWNPAKNPKVLLSCYLPDGSKIPYIILTDTGLVIHAPHTSYYHWVEANHPSEAINPAWLLQRALSYWFDNNTDVFTQISSHKVFQSYWKAGTYIGTTLVNISDKSKKVDLSVRLRYLDKGFDPKQKYVIYDVDRDKVVDSPISIDENGALKTKIRLPLEGALRVAFVPGEVNLTGKVRAFDSISKIVRINEKPCLQLSEYVRIHAHVWGNEERKWEEFVGGPASEIEHVMAGLLPGEKYLIETDTGWSKVLEADKWGKAIFVYDGKWTELKKTRKIRRIRKDEDIGGISVNYAGFSITPSWR